MNDTKKFTVESWQKLKKYDKLMCVKSSESVKIAIQHSHAIRGIMNKIGIVK